MVRCVSWVNSECLVTHTDLLIRYLCYGLRLYHWSRDSWVFMLLQWNR